MMAFLMCIATVVTNVLLCQNDKLFQLRIIIIGFLK